MIDNDTLSTTEEPEEGLDELPLAEGMAVDFKGNPLTVGKVDEDMIRFQRPNGFVFAMGIDKVREHFRRGEIETAA